MDTHFSAKSFVIAETIISLLSCSVLKSLAVSATDVISVDTSMLWRLSLFRISVLASLKQSRSCPTTSFDFVSFLVIERMSDKAIPFSVVSRFSCLVACPSCWISWILVTLHFEERERGARAMLGASLTMAGTCSVSRRRLVLQAFCLPPLLKPRPNFLFALFPLNPSFPAGGALDLVTSSVSATFSSSASATFSVTSKGTSSAGNPK